MVYSWPIFSYGFSTGLAPIQVKMQIIEIKIQNLIFFVGLNFDGLDFERTKIAGIKTDKARAITPPSFDGIDRRIT